MKSNPLVNMITFEAVAIELAVHAGLAGADGQGVRTVVTSILALSFAGLSVKAYRRWRRTRQ